MSVFEHEDAVVVPASERDGRDGHDVAVDLAGAGSDRLRRLAEAFVALNATLSLDEVVERVTTEAREIIGAHQAVTSFTSGRDWAQSINTVSLSDKYAAWRDLKGVPDGTGIYHLVCERNQPMRLTQEELERHESWRAFGASAADHPPLRGWLAAPLVGRDGRNLGLVQLSDKVRGDFDADDEAALVQLAQLASIAVENASLYERERATARQLQHELMPQRLPAGTGLDTAVRYRAGADDIDVGGDWYDVVRLDDGRIGLVVGDVMGRGVHAASVMGQLRIALRAYALEGMSPARTLAALDRLVDTLDGEYFVTAVYAVWDLAADSVTFASAGHPSPLLRLADRTTRFLKGSQGMPIGVAPDVGHTDHRVDAPPGSTLVLYTDGLVEHRDIRLDTTLGTLARLTAGGPQGADALADHLLAGMPAVDGDDVAVLIATRPAGDGPPPRPGVDRAVEVALDAAPESAGRARRWVADTLASEGLADPGGVVALLTTELVTNAVVHTAAPVRVHLAVDGDRLRVAVHDREPDVPSVSAVDAEAPRGRGMVIVDALAPEWGVHVHPDGKSVWFAVPAVPAAPDDPAPADPAPVESAAPDDRAVDLP